MFAKSNREQGEGEREIERERDRERERERERQTDRQTETETDRAVESINISRIELRKLWRHGDNASDAAIRAAYWAFVGDVQPTVDGWRVCFVWWRAGVLI